MINVVFFSFLFPKIKKILILGNIRGVIMLKEGVLMKLIERKDYLEKVINAIGTPDIKVITGVHRSGKSKLLEAFKSYVNANIENAKRIKTRGTYNSVHASHFFIFLNNRCYPRNVITA